MLATIEIPQELESELDGHRTAWLGAFNECAEKLAYAYFVVDLKGPRVQKFHLTLTRIANGWVTQHLVWIESYGSCSGPTDKPVHLAPDVKDTTFDLTLTIG